MFFDKIKRLIDRNFDQWGKSKAHCFMGDRKRIDYLDVAKGMAILAAVRFSLGVEL